MACCPYMKWKTKKVLKKMSENRVKRTVLCRKRKSHFISWFVFKQVVTLECWYEKKKNKFFTEICNKTATCVQIWCEKRKSNYFWNGVIKFLLGVQTRRLKRNWNYFEKSATKQGFYSLYGVKLRKSKLFLKIGH